MVWLSYGMVPGTVWYGMAWYGVWYNMSWQSYGIVLYGWYGIIWYGIVRYGMVPIVITWYGMVWYGLSRQSYNLYKHSITPIPILGSSIPNNLNAIKNTKYHNRSI